METASVPVPNLGKHQLSLADRVVMIEVRGTVSLQEAELLMDYILHCDRTEPNLGMLVLAAEEFSVSPEARRFMVKSSNRERPPIPMAVVGTGIVARAILTLLINAIRITMRMDVPMGFFVTEAEARAWLTVQLVHRAELLAHKR